MMTKYYGVNLDECIEDLFEFLEEVQDGKSGHKIAVLGENSTTASKMICEHLQLFFNRRMYPSDEYGNKSPI